MPHSHTLPDAGESAPFHLVSVWTVPTTAELTWPVLTDVARWPAWWPGIASAQVVRPGSVEGLGRRAELVVRSVLGYRLTLQVELTGAEAPYRSSLTVAGDLRGTGTWAAQDQRNGTRMTIVWCVVTDRSLLRLLRPVARWAHDRTMVAGEAGLRRRLAHSS